MTLFKTTNDSAIILIRLMVGVVFLSEGIQKFIFSSQLGAGRFEKIGLPNPEFLAPFVASFEIVCGTLVLFSNQVGFYSPYFNHADSFKHHQIVNFNE